MLTVGENAGNLTQEPRATVPVDCSENRLPHERAASARARDGINLGDDLIVEVDVHSHVSYINT